MAEAQKKKKPGRPRKVPVVDPNPREGIADEPDNKKNYIEFSYDTPMLFRKLWNYFKLMSVDKLHIIFRKDCVIMWGRDHHRKSQVRTKILADKVNHYFAQDEIDIGIISKNLEIIMSKVDKTYTAVQFASMVGQTQSDIHVILKNSMQIDEIHRVRLVGEYDRLEDERMFLAANDYTIHFVLPGKYFKKMIADLKSFASQVAICQDGPGSPLVFEYITVDRQVSSRNVVRENELIKFKSKLEEGDTFRVGFHVDYVKQISSALLADNVTIYAHEGKPLMFVVEMDDGAIQLQILTDIIDNRDAE